jgi:hypothetical protein
MQACDRSAKFRRSQKAKALQLNQKAKGIGPYSQKEKDVDSLRSKKTRLKLRLKQQVRAFGSRTTRT